MDSPDRIHHTVDAHTKNCPDCDSADTRAVQNIYDIAKNYSRSSLSRVAVTGGAGFYLDGSNVRPTPETLMAAKFPPPKRPRFSWWTLIAVMLTAGFVYFVLTEWVGVNAPAALGISILIIIADYILQTVVQRSGMIAYKKEYAAWQQQRICMDCETAFIPVTA